MEITMKWPSMKSLLSGLALSSLLACAQAQAQAQAQADDIVVEQLVKSTASWDGEQLPAYGNGQPEITVLKFTIPAGARLASHTHSAINAGVLLSGSLTVVSEDQEVLHLKPGDALVELVDKLHHGQNDGEEPAVIVVFYAGIKGQEFTHVEAATSH